MASGIPPLRCLRTGNHNNQASSILDRSRATSELALGAGAGAFHSSLSPSSEALAVLSLSPRPDALTPVLAASSQWDTRSRGRRMSSRMVIEAMPGWEQAQAY
jgi:hypothetical protein